MNDGGMKIIFHSEIRSGRIGTPTFSVSISREGGIPLVMHDMKGADRRVHLEIVVPLPKDRRD